MPYSMDNHLLDSIEKFNLNTVTLADIRWRYGTFRPYSTGSGRDKKHFSRSGVATPIGDIREDVWYQLAEHIAQRDEEQWLVDALVQWNTDYNYGKNNAAERRREALQSYANRIFDNPRWVIYIPFNRKYRPKMLETARLVTVACDCCGVPGEVTQEQIDDAYQCQISCPSCGRWNTFRLLSEEIPPWDMV